MLLELIATFCAGLFAGAAIYINLVEHPARLECGAELAATVFGPSYRRAAVLQASLAAVGFLAALAARLQGSDLEVLIGGVLLGAVIPFTLFVVQPLNSRLLGADPRGAASEIMPLLRRWGRLHAVRSVAGTVAFGLLLWHLGGRI